MTPMPLDESPLPARYTFTFRGRRVGARGVTYACERTVEAATLAAARLKLYETHEHISACTCTHIAPLLPEGAHG